MYMYLYCKNNIRINNSIDNVNRTPPLLAGASALLVQARIRNRCIERDTER